MHVLGNAHGAAEGEGLRAITLVGLALAAGVDGQIAVDHLDVDGLAIHPGKLGADIGIFLVLVESDGKPLLESRVHDI